MTEKPCFPIHKAIDSGVTPARFKAILAKLKPNEELPDSKDELGDAAIHLLALSDSCHDPVAMLHLLLAYYTEKCGSTTATVLDLRDEDGDTVLHVATRLRKYALVDAVLELGRSVSATAENHKNRLPIHYVAGETGVGINILRKLIRHTPNSYNYNKDVRSPVELAAKHSNVECLVVFKENNFSFLPRDGRHLFRYTLLTGDEDVSLECLKFLLEVDKEQRNLFDSDRSHPIIRAAKKQFPGHVRAYLEHEGRVDYQFQQDCRKALSCLTSISTPKSIECAELLLNWRYYDYKVSRVAIFVNLTDYKYKKIKELTALDVCLHEKNAGVAKTILLATYSHSTSPAFNYWLEHDVIDKIYQQIPLAMVAVLDEALKSQPELADAHNFTVITGIKTEPDDDDDDDDDDGTESDDESRSEIGSDSSDMLNTPSAHLQHVLQHDAGVQEQVLLHPLTQLYSVSHQQVDRLISSLSQFHTKKI